LKTSVSNHYPDENEQKKYMKPGFRNHSKGAICLAAFLGDDAVKCDGIVYIFDRKVKLGVWVQVNIRIFARLSK
jgi:hypothetical protein